MEFEDKRVAKQVAQMLNGQAMGGKRRSAYHYDLWCLKYLSKFKWDHLTEEIGARRPLRRALTSAHLLTAALVVVLPASARQSQATWMMSGV